MYLLHHKSMFSKNIINLCYALETSALICLAVFDIEQSLWMEHFHLFRTHFELFILIQEFL